MAQTQFEASLRLFEKCEDRRGQAWVLERLSYVLRDQGQLGEAEKCAAAYRTLPPKWG